MPDGDGTGSLGYGPRSGRGFGHYNGYLNLGYNSCGWFGRRFWGGNKQRLERG